MTPAIESDLLRLVADVCAAAAGLGCLYLAVAGVVVLRFATRCERLSASAVPVTIIKPLQGAEPGLSRRLIAFCRQAYGASIQLICGIRDRSDPAVEVVRQLTDARRKLPIDLNIDASLHGANHKVSNLANALPLARHDVLVMADSDIDVGPDYLARVVAQLQRPGVGVVTCVYHGVAAGGVWSRLAALAINGHFLPSVIVGVSSGLATPCFGSTIAVRRQVLREIGGLKAFADALADDYAIGDAVRSAGYRVAIPSFSLAQACFHADLRSLISHELRGGAHHQEHQAAGLLRHDHQPSVPARPDIGAPGRGERHAARGHGPCRARHALPRRGACVRLGAAAPLQHPLHELSGV